MPQATTISRLLESGVTAAVTAVSNRAFRLRISRAGVSYHDGLHRYGILSPGATGTPSIEESEDAVTVMTETAALRVSLVDGAFELFARDARPSGESAAGVGRMRSLTSGTRPEIAEEGGYRGSLALKDEAECYGLGDETRDFIAKRGHRASLWVRNVATYVPVPVLLTTAGWGALLAGTWRSYIDVDTDGSGTVGFGATGGPFDLYLFAGDDLSTLLSEYTAVAGRPALLPMWAYGLTFVCNQQASARDMLEVARAFREKEIPCDLIGLEPGWMSTRYDYSTEKDWHPERFYVPHWFGGGLRPEMFSAALHRMGFRLSLWLCCDYDLSFEEERRAGTPIGGHGAKGAGASGNTEHEKSSPGGDSATAAAGFHPDDFERDERLGHGEVYQDTITKPGEPWFDHLKRFVDQGASAFKMDGALQVNEHPDRRWANGMDDEEMHNLYPVLLNKQMHLGFREHTGLRPMIYSSGGFTGIQQYAATWAGDTGGGEKPLVSILNHALSGHSNAGCDMHVFSAEGLHFGFLLPWSQVCSWAYWRHPWYLGEELESIFLYYDRLRYRLLPYLYSAAAEAHMTGLPMVRPMPLCFPAMPTDLVRQYLLGPDLLVGAFTDEIVLPESEWLNAWTGELLVGESHGRSARPAVPADRGGPLLLRGGTILPTWHQAQHVKTTAPEEIVLCVICGSPRLQATVQRELYEDDGETVKHRHGQYSVATLAYRQDGAAARVSISRRSGVFYGMPESRRYRIEIYCPSGISARLDGGTRADTPSSAGQARPALDPLQPVQTLILEEPRESAPIHVNIRIETV